MLVCCYVDDLVDDLMIFTENCASFFKDLKKEMTYEFEIKDIGLMSYYLDIEVKEPKDGIFISQQWY